ncbi:HD domain-containing phosphohydrolase [endosymbiont of Lamellibrachia barhami]|uniref:HD domain-containing phosphohydrolase n=1 Tax=endosymbiont of Lamellibrachia barhami TaxID=205975 RepID=UPI0015ACAAF2|nr:HD domain-containing phosphohydrolase [endosymbiont of Lamellibrachia barhami]
MEQASRVKRAVEKQEDDILRPDDRIRLLLVDDESSILSSLQRLFRGAVYEVHTAGGGDEALQLLAERPIDVIVSDMRMPGMSGLEFLTNVESLYPDVMRIVLSGYAEPESVIDVVNEAKIFSYVHKPWDDLDLKLKVKNAAERLYLKRLTRKQNIELDLMSRSLEEKVRERTAALEKAQEKLQHSYKELDESYQSMVKMLSHYSEIGIPSMGNHGQSVARYASRFAKSINLDEEASRDIVAAALLHDIGLVVVSDAVLAKPKEARSREENKIIEKHAVLGENTLMGLPAMRGAAKLVRHHHELFNGRGYPDRRIGKDIPLGSRIILIANDYENMIEGRGMEKPLSRDDALAYIEKHASQYYDPDLAVDFCKMIRAEADDAPHGQGNIRVVHSDALEPGMLLHENLLNKDGMLLLTSGQRLTGSTIVGIKRLEKSDRHRYTLYILTKKD